MHEARNKKLNQTSLSEAKLHKVRSGRQSVGLELMPGGFRVVAKGLELMVASELLS